LATACAGIFAGAGGGAGLAGFAVAAGFSAAFSGGPAYGRTDEAVGFFKGVDFEGGAGGFWGMSQALWQGTRVIRQPQINSTVITA
jgi:hypothetical protein